MPTDYEIIGVRHAEYDRKSDHTHVNAYEVHMTYVGRNVTGLAVQSAFVYADNLNGYIPKVGDVVHLFYNRWGRVETLQPVG